MRLNAVVMVLMMTMCGCDSLLNPYEVRESESVFVPSGIAKIGATLQTVSELCAELSSDPFETVEACQQLDNAVPDGIAHFVTPVQLVEFDPFYIDRYEVTVAAYQYCVEAGSCNEQILQYVYDFSPPASINEPMRYLSYYDAQAFCDWRNGRLPTEAEWEYAARGPLSHTFPWGNEFDGTAANFCDVNCEWNRVADTKWNDGFEHIAPVDAMRDDRSWVGVLGMAGNISEWTETIYAEQERVVKGGTYGDLAYRIASWNRLPMDENQIREGIGFRCVYDVGN